MGKVNFHVVRSALLAVFCLQNLKFLLVIFADQVLIFPTFFDVFVGGPLQSFVVDICIFSSPVFEFVVAAE